MSAWSASIKREYTSAQRGRLLFCCTLAIDENLFNGTAVLEKLPIKAGPYLDIPPMAMISHRMPPAP